SGRAARISQFGYLRGQETPKSKSAQPAHAGGSQGARQTDRPLQARSENETATRLVETPAAGRSRITLPATPWLIAKQEAIADRHESAVKSAEDQFAILDEDDPLGPDSPRSGRPRSDHRAGRCGAREKNQAITKPCLDHDGPVRAMPKTL